LELTDANIAQMVRQGTWYCPTLMVYTYNHAAAGTPDGIRDQKRVDVHGPSFQKAMKAGVKIVFGTDVGGFPWTDSIAKEFSMMVGFGMSPMEAIRSATSRPAVMLDMKGKIGVIATGAFADIIAVSENPLQKISALENIGFVMKDGAVFRNEMTH
jgi:imidazolonepropionase-like amidohydrolase